MSLSRHCERSDAASSLPRDMDCFAALAMRRQAASLITSPRLTALQAGNPPRKTSGGTYDADASSRSPTSLRRHLRLLRRRHAALRRPAPRTPATSRPSRSMRPGQNRCRTTGSSARSAASPSTAQGHIWVIHRPRSLTDDEKGASLTPPRSKCCVSAPPVLEFDADGNLLRSWGGPGEGYEWVGREHGIEVDEQRLRLGRRQCRQRQRDPEIHRSTASS